MEGIYQIYSLRFSADGQKFRRLIGRVLFDNAYVRILEDHGHRLHRLLPEGALTQRTIQRFESLSRSGYHEVVHEGDLHEGMHPEHVPEMDLRHDPQPDAVYTVVDATTQTHHHLEVYAHVGVLDGTTLSAEQLETLMARVHAGTLRLVPQ